MATNIPLHNLTEVVNATIELVKNPRAGLARNAQARGRPRFPTGGFLYGKPASSPYKTGRGRFMVRARVSHGKCHKERQAIIVTEFPDQVNKSNSSSASPN